MSTEDTEETHLLSLNADQESNYRWQNIPWKWIISIGFLILMIIFCIILSYPIYVCTINHNVIFEGCYLSFTIWILRTIFLISIFNGLTIFWFQYRQWEFVTIYHWRDTFLPFKKYATDAFYFLTIFTLINLCLGDNSPFLILNLLEVIVVMSVTLTVNRSIPVEIKRFKIFLMTLSIEQFVLFFYDSLRGTFDVIAEKDVGQHILTMKLILLGTMILFRYTVFTNLTKKIYYPEKDVFPTWAPSLT